MSTRDVVQEWLSMSYEGVEPGDADELLKLIFGQVLNDE